MPIGSDKDQLRSSNEARRSSTIEAGATLATVPAGPASADGDAADR